LAIGRTNVCGKFIGTVFAAMRVKQEEPPTSILDQETLRKAMFSGHGFHGVAEDEPIQTILSADFFLRHSSHTP